MGNKLFLPYSKSAWKDTHFCYTLPVPQMQRISHGAYCAEKFVHQLSRSCFLQKPEFIFIKLKKTLFFQELCKGKLDKQ